MRERPILFSGPMVRALLADIKTQTRRVVKPQPRRVDGGVPFGDAPAWAHAEPGSAMMRCPYGIRGDRLWVREAWRPVHSGDKSLGAQYRADVSRDQTVWRPSIHMPRWASRITLEVTGVRVERLQDIGEADATSEGVDSVYGDLYGIAEPGERVQRAKFHLLWESINGPGSWAENPLVWAVEFRRVGAG